MTTAGPPPGDFDFLYHDWTVHHRKLATRLAGADDWCEFEGLSSTRPVLGGFGNIEDNVLMDPNGTYRALAVRNYDAETGLWRIWWLDMRFPDAIGVPVVGRFNGGRGEFVTDDTHLGKPVKLRFLWQVDAGQGPRWEQALSADGGVTWETNWQMGFRRAGAGK
jgi:hypothetical protein